MKIALCIPCHGQTMAKFTQCMGAMIAHTMRSRFEIDGEPVQPDIEIFMVSCSLLTESRNRLIAEAINWEADYMLWMDADHVFPCDSLVRLLSHNLPVVGCNYARRFNPTSPTASLGKGELVWSDKGMGVQPVAHMGLGLCLIDMRVYGALEQQAEAEGLPHFWPLFRIDPTPDGIRFIGEDVYYFAKLRRANVPIHCDHDLSVDVGHISEQILTYAHALRDKPKWEEHNKTKLDKFKVREAAE